MTIQNVFGSTAPSAINVGSDTDQIVLGFLFKVATAGNVVGYRFYDGQYPLWNSAYREGSLWTVAGVQLATKVSPNRTNNGWIEVLFDAPVAIAANTPYMISVFHDLGNWSATFAALEHDVVSGDITIYGSDNVPDGGAWQGRYIETPTNAFPVNGSGGKSSYGVDVMFDAGSTQVDISGTSSLTFAASGALSRRVNLAGNSAISIGASGVPSRQVNISGTSPLTVAASGRPTLTRRLSGLAAMLFRGTGRISVTDPNLVISEHDGVYIEAEERGRFITEEIRGIYK